MLHAALRVCLATLLGVTSTCVAVHSARAQSSPTERILAAVRKMPKPVPVKGAGDYVYYELKIENLCGAGSITEAATAWVDEMTITERAVAMSVTYTFPNSYPNLSDITIPLIAVANSGDRGVQNCAPITVKDIPRNQEATARFDFSTKEGFRFLDASGVLASFGKLAGAVGGIAAPGGGIVFTGAAAAVSFLTSNTKPLKDLTDSTNELLKLLDRDRKPRGVVSVIARSTGRASYLAERKEVFAVQKSYYDTLIKSEPSQPYWAIPADFSRVAGKDWNDVVRDVLNAYPAFWENMARFCPALRNTLSAAAHSDTISIAVGLYYHAAANSDSYGQIAKRTCLNTQEFKQLATRGWGRPFDGALSFQNVPWPGTPQVVAASTPR
jgi:hypothetical protein